MAADAKSILKFIMSHSGEYTRDEVISKVRPSNNPTRNSAQVALTSLLSSHTITRISRDRLVPTAKAQRMLNGKSKRMLSRDQVERVEEHESWLDSPLEGNIPTRPASFIRVLKTNTSRVYIEPLQTSRRLFVEATLVEAPRLNEYLVKIRTRSSEFKRDERAITIDINHLRQLRDWSDRVLKKIATRGKLK